MVRLSAVDHRNRKWLITSVVSVKYGYMVVLLTCVYIDTGVNFRFKFLRYFVLLHEDLNFSEWTLKWNWDCLRQYLCSLVTVQLVSQCLCKWPAAQHQRSEVQLERVCVPRSWDDALISPSWKVKNRHSLLVSISLWVTFEQIQGLYVKNPNAGRLSSALLWMITPLGPLYSHFCKITNIIVRYILL